MPMHPDYYLCIGATASRVSIFGSEVLRPRWISPKQWLDFWDDVKLNPLHLEAADEECAQLKRDNATLKTRVAQLTRQVADLDRRHQACAEKLRAFI